MDIYPWYDKTFNTILLNETLYHSQIFYGGDKTGRNNFVLQLCKVLLCNQSKENLDSCNVCNSCQWINNSSHPDLFIIDETDEKLNINIDSVRQLKEFFELSSHQQNGLKIAVILNTENLTNSSANALLKILEEPPNNCFIFLATNYVSAILPTIRSRANLISLPKPTRSELNKYINLKDIELQSGELDFFNNSVDLLNNEHNRYNLVIDIINELKKGRSIKLTNIDRGWLDYGLTWFIEVIQKWTYDISLSKLTKNLFYFPNEHKIINQLASNSSLEKLLSFHKKINEIKFYSTKPVNKDLNLDLIIIEYKKIFS